jgi:hypothetical protein
VSARRGVTMTRRGHPAANAKMRLSATRLDPLIEEATVDAYGESERQAGFQAVIEDHLAVPFSTQVLGADVIVERVEMADDDRIVAVCRRGRSQQRIGILDLPLPDPPPDGAEWIDAYRRWASGNSSR